jgi:heat shock protein HslJ
LKKILFLTVLYTGLLTLTACASSGPQGGGGDLTGKVWALTALNGQHLVAGTNISAQFTSDGIVSGSAGCNQYTGKYTVSGGNIAFDPSITTTMMACLQPVMEQESAYLKMLAKAKTYTVNGDELTFTGADKRTLATYKAETQDLAGTNWDAIGYNNGKQAVVSVMLGTSITANFSTDGNLTGNAGCNDYNGTYTVKRNQIVIGPLVTTRKICNDPVGVMEQEAQYLTALGTAETYQIEGATLELRTKDGALVANFSHNNDRPVSATEASATNQIQNINWKWVNVTNQTTNEVMEVPDPSLYTITFHEDGTLDGKADCNSFRGTYSQENGFTITLGPSTMAFCGEASLDTTYLSLLSSIVAGGPDGAGGLALETAGGEQRMLFK